MTKQEANNWYRRIIRCIKSKRFCVKLKSNPVEFGRFEPGTPDEIVINPRIRTPIMRTIVHECIHFVDNNLSETDVCKLERDLFNAMSDRQLEGLLKKLMVFDLGTID